MWRLSPERGEEQSCARLGCEEQKKGGRPVSHMHIPYDAVGWVLSRRVGVIPHVVFFSHARVSSFRVGWGVGWLVGPRSCCCYYTQLQTRCGLALLARGCGWLMPFYFS